MSEHVTGEIVSETEDPADPRAFFTLVAERVALLIRPSRVLDFGSARGDFVRAFCEQGIDAYGIVASGVIDTVNPAIRGRLSIDATSATTKRWDLISWSGIGEHLSQVNVEAGIDAICKATDRVLLYSTPSDSGESRQVNRRAQANWASAFADRGLYRRTDLDLASASLWASIFERSPEAISDLVQRYEEWTYPMLVELLDDNRSSVIEAMRTLRVALSHGTELVTTSPELDALKIKHSEVAQELQETRHHLLTCRDELIGSEAEIDRLRQKLQAEIEERDRLWHECQSLQRQISNKRSSVGWRIWNALVWKLDHGRQKRAKR
jgi:hypothetical protein